MKVKLHVVLAFIIIASACSSLKPAPHSTVDARINNIVWGVVTFKGHVLNQAAFPNGLPYISFNMQESKISGSDGCDNFMGVATYKGNTITPGPIASTKMACQGTDIQSDFYDALASTHLAWRLDGETLRLLVNDAEVMTLKERE